MIEKGKNYLVYESKTQFTYERFREFLTDGTRGLCITTNLPQKIKKEYELPDTNIIWLADIKTEDEIDGEYIVKPSNLEELKRQIIRFMKKGGDCVVMIEDIEYLVIENGYDDVQRFLKTIADEAAKNPSTLIVPLNPQYMSEEILSAIKGTFDQIEDVRSIILTGNKIECPICGAMWKTHVSTCDICGHEFDKSCAEPMEEPSEEKTEAPLSQQIGPEKLVDKKKEPVVPKMKEKSDVYDDSVRPTEETWFRRGVALEKMGKSEEAIECFDKAIELNPNDSWAWFNKGVSLHRLGYLSEALYCYDKALSLNPNDPDILSNKGIALRMTGKPQEALACYEKALVLSPKDSGILSNMGVTYRVLGETKKSIETYNKALAIRPRDIGIILNKAAAHMSLGEFDMAIQCYEDVLKIDSGNAAAQRNRELATHRHLRS